MVYQAGRENFRNQLVRSLPFICPVLLYEKMYH